MSRLRVAPRASVVTRPASRRLPFRVAAAPQIIAVDQAVETDLAQALTAAKALAVAQALETDLAQSVTVQKIVAVGQVTETDLAQPIIWAPMHRLVGQAAETDVSQAITPAVVGGAAPTYRVTRAAVAWVA